MLELKIRTGRRGREGLKMSKCGCFDTVMYPGSARYSCARRFLWGKAALSINHRFSRHLTGNCLRQRVIIALLLFNPVGSQVLRDLISNEPTSPLLGTPRGARSSPYRHLCLTLLAILMHVVHLDRCGRIICTQGAGESGLGTDSGRTILKPLQVESP